MCRLFIGADPELWLSVTRSLRIDGAATSVRLENFFWWTLEDIAARDGLTATRLIGKLYDESVTRGMTSTISHRSCGFAVGAIFRCNSMVWFPLTSRLPSPLWMPMPFWRARRRTIASGNRHGRNLTSTTTPRNLRHPKAVPHLLANLSRNFDHLNAL